MHTPDFVSAPASTGLDTPPSTPIVDSSTCVEDLVQQDAVASEQYTLPCVRCSLCTSSSANMNLLQIFGQHCERTVQLRQLQLRVVPFVHPGRISYSTRRQPCQQYQGRTPVPGAVPNTAAEPVGARRRIHYT